MVHYGNPCKSQEREKEAFYEGLINISHRMVSGQKFSSVDSVLTNSKRTMFIYKNYAIGIRIKFVFDNKILIRKDTTSYVFYNFDKRSFIEFEHLSLNTEIIEKGQIDEQRAFSNLEKYDPLSDYPNSLLLTTDTIVNGTKVQKVQLKPKPTVGDSLYLKYFKIPEFWINSEIKKFPLQLSYSLSKKRNDDFVYKYELPVADETGDAYTIMELEYQPKKLPDSLISIFKMLSKQ